MWKADPGKNMIPMMSVLYQFYYMLSDKCTIDKVINDFFIFCWNKGCYANELGANAENNFFYMTRSLIDASIVWFEGVPASMHEDQDKWRNLSRQTGETFAEIIKEFTNFKKQTEMDA